MMQHVVMFRRLPHVAEDPHREAALVQRMRDLDQEIDFIRDWRVSANELARPICWDYLLEATFDDAASVERYLPHPMHQALIAELKHYFEWVACDYTR